MVKVHLCWICERPITSGAMARVKVREPNGYDSTMTTWRYRAHSDCVRRMRRVVQQEQDAAYTELPRRIADAPPPPPPPRSR